ncbi:hypothetical protein [Chromobacterium amazonense]|uniref:hypothetical protein n=1 Tax=Chromobacterium amazonense TaxID=1382803 RepID=UPI003B96955A
MFQDLTVPDIIQQILSEHQQTRRCPASNPRNTRAAATTNCCSTTRPAKCASNSAPNPARPSSTKAS